MTSTAFRGFGARTAEVRKTATKSVWGNKPRKGSPKIKPTPEARRCRECKDRWAQEGGICRTCRTADLTDNAETQARRARERYLREQTSGVVQKVYVDRKPRPTVIDGVEYDVMWDGRV